MENKNTNEYRPIHLDSSRPQREVRPNSDALERARRKRIIELKRKKKRRKKAILVSAVIILIIAIGAIAAVGFVNKLMLPKPDVKAKNTVSGIKLSWGKIEGAERYEIFKSTGGKYTVVKSLSKTAFTDKKAKNGQVCKYKVFAVSEDKTGLKANVSAVRLAPVEITDTKSDEKSITIKWAALDTAKQYEIFRRSGEAEAEKIKTFDAGKTSFKDKDIETDEVYYYAVRQVTNHGSSPLPEEKAVASASTKLESATVKNSPYGVRISWTGKIDAATSYNIYRKTGGEWKLAGTAATGESSFIDKDAEYGKKSSYKVCAVFNANNEGEATEAGSVYAVDPSKKLVALTYDDGPYAPVTNQILDAMEKHNSRCTFFVVGNRVESYNSCVTRAAKLGCEIGSHTYEHKYLTQLSDEELKYQLDETKKVIEKYSGSECTILRPPGGFSKSGVAYPQILWSVDTQDWSNRNTATTLANAKSHIFDGCIVLMHDLYESSGQATVSLVPYLVENGYQLVTVSELMDARGITMQNGVNYYSASKQAS